MKLDSTHDFTPGTASKLLPLIRSIVRDMSELSDSINLQRQQLVGLDEIGEMNSDDAYEEEVADVRSSLLEVEQRFESCRTELEALGVEPHDPFDGSVDFPSTLDNRKVNLCWRADDDSVRHWHELGEGTAERKLLEPEVALGPAV
ncbi:DUF2203 domain-containing protein [bacterium]|nr:DUF2203 domain-containing protein [bacterium]MDC0295546.1 DUF2203 domain-containing protein [bacterium]